MKHWVIAGGALAVFAGHASADVLFDNFGPGDTYALDIGATLAYGGPLGGETHEAAVAFTVTGGNYYLDSAEFAVLHNWGPDLVYANIHSDLESAPGTIIAGTTATGVTQPFEWAPPMVATFDDNILLEDGETYWLALRTEETDALLSWAHNVTDDFGLRAWRINEGPWNTAFGEPGTDSQRGVFRINATPIPAPGAIMLLACGALAMRRRRA